MLIIKKLSELLTISNIQRIKFRHDINGLRAIAVLSVVFYHAGLDFFKGGWVGVDIFFVISGYLISNIIISGLNEENFSFRAFYLRRARRILPALFSTLLLTIPFAYFFLTPNELSKYIDSLIASVFFFANYHFMNLNFYVLESTKLMPLLHTWSLAIEEQYYLLFPLFALVLYKFFKNYFTLIITFIILGSLYLNTLSQNSDKFYRLEFRLWELLLGVLIMILSSNFKIKNLEKLGLPLMLFSIFYFDDSWINDIEPKLIALIGISLIIFSNKESTLLTKGLSSKFISIIGKSSYSIYLLHQPIFAFTQRYKISNFENYRTNNLQLNSLEIVFLILLTILLGYFSYKKIEVYFLKTESNNYLSILFISLLLIIFLISKVIITTKDFDNSFESNFFNLNDNLCLDRNIDDLCKIENNSNKTIYAIGDSSLSPISKVLSEIFIETKDYNFIDITGRACLFVFDIQVHPKGCLNFEKNQLDSYIEKINNSIIIYSVELTGYLGTEGFYNGYVQVENWEREAISNEDIEKVINNTFDRLLLKDNIIILIYPIPEQGWDVPSIHKNLQNDNTISYPYEFWIKRRNSSHLIYDKIENKNIFKIYPENIFCNSFIKNECVGALNNSIFYMDHYHLSSEGAELVVKDILKILRINN